MNGKSSTAVLLCSGGDKEADKMVPVQFMERFFPLGAVDDALRYAYLRWTAAKGGENEKGVERLKGKKSYFWGRMTLGNAF